MRLPLILMLSCAVMACGSSKSEPEAKPEVKPVESTEWPGCRELAARLGAAADVVYSAPPKFGKPPARWKVKFLDLEVWVPKVDYEVVKRADSGSVSTILKADGHIITLIKDPPLETQGDVFQIAGEAETAAGRAATKKFFGKEPTLHDLADLGYKHTRADITCAAARRDEEVMIASALVLKSTAGPGKLVAVYRDRTGLGDIVYVRETPDGWLWEAQISTADASYTIGYRTAGRSYMTVRPWGDDSEVTAPAALQNLAE